MTNTMINRLCLAIEGALQKARDSQNGPDVYLGEIDDHCLIIDGYVDLKAIARAAIEAMREPTVEMLAAMNASGHVWNSPTVFDDGATRIWQLAINAALKED